jgi:hypothetical protein
MSRPSEENPSDRLEQTARELRRHRPRPSAALVARVERLAESQAHEQPRRLRPRPSRRRLVFALAAMLAIAVAGGVIAGELGQSSKQAASPMPLDHTPKVVVTSATETNGHFTAAQEGDLTDSQLYAELPPAAAKPADVLSGASGETVNQAAKKRASVAPITTGKRLAELHATLTLKVENSDQLSKRTAEAMRIVRSLNGYVVSTSVNVPSRGVASSYLVLKVPATRSQEALIRISELGKIISQQVSLEDVQATVNTQTKSIETLKREIASIEKTLAEEPLTPEARSQLQIQLARDRAQLSSLETQRTTNIARGRLATIELTFTTGDLPKPAAHPGRIHKAIDRAWNGLSSEISWVAMAVIVASPFLLLGALLVPAYRLRRRREERRLLEK